MTKLITFHGAEAEIRGYPFTQSWLHSDLLLSRSESKNGRALWNDSVVVNEPHQEPSISWSNLYFWSCAKVIEKFN